MVDGAQVVHKFTTKMSRLGRVADSLADASRDKDNVPTAGQQLN